MTAYLLIILLTLFNALGGMFLKLTSGAGGLRASLRRRELYIGSALYLAAGALNVYVLTLLPLSKVVPLLSFSYIWVLLLAYFLLKEPLSPRKLLGLLCVVAGAVLVAV